MLTIRASGLARPMSCAGSLFVTDLPEDRENEAAREGTAAGEMLRWKVEGKPYGTHASNGVAFTPEMEFYTTPIAESMLANAMTPIRCEEHVPFVTRSGIEISGHYDASYIGKDGNLWIEDLKFGWGLVEVKNNWQLLAYAIGEVIRLNQYFPEIVLVIRQPRPHHEDGDRRVWRVKYEELLMYKEQIERRMEQIADGDKTFVTGPQCKYCKAASKCPALSKAFHHAIEVVNEFVEDEITETEIAFQMDMISRIEDLVRIKKDSITTLAMDRVKKGKVIPNYALEQVQGNREWNKDITPTVIKAITGKDVITQEMLSPAKAEKIGIPKDVIAAFTKREFKGTKLKKIDSNALGERYFGKKDDVRQF